MNEQLREAYKELYQIYPELNIDIEIPGLKVDNSSSVGLDAYSKRTCKTCIKVKLNIHDCCKSHPVTGQQSTEGYCPNLELENGLCRVYNTPEYPSECRDFSCVHRIKD